MYYTGTLRIAGVPPFKPDLISVTVLQRLIRQDIIRDFHLKDTNEKEAYLYTSGKPVDYFIMILQGNAEVLIGKEQLKFEAGAFMFFGTQALAGKQ